MKVYLTILYVLAVSVQAALLAVAAKNGTHSNSEATDYPSNKEFMGTECYQQSVWPENCPKQFSSMCLPGSRCVMWKSGRFRETLNEVKRATPFSQPCQSLNYSNGNFQDGMWKVSDCDVRHYSPYEMRQVLRNKRISFFGVSHLRQMFLRMIFFIRGFVEGVAEHYFHQDAFYAMNGEEDFLFIGQSYVKFMKSGEKLKFEPTTILSFFFNLEVDSSNAADLEGNLVNLFVVGGGYGWKDDLKTQLKQFPSQRTIFLNSIGDDPKAIERNKWIKDNVKVYLPFREMAAANLYKFNVGHMGSFDCHYQCGILNQFENTQRLRAGGFKSPPNGDCRDMISINLNNMLLNYIEHHL